MPTCHEPYCSCNKHAPELELISDSEKLQELLSSLKSLYRYYADHELGRMVMCNQSGDYCESTDIYDLIEHYSGDVTK